MDVDGSQPATFHLPVGMATFLLADVASPARLQESTREVAAAALTRLDTLVDEKLSRYGGVRRPHHGDAGVVASFTRASDALAAALDIQRDIQAGSWVEPLTLRIAVHTAEAQRRDEGDYFGQAVNRGVRLWGIAHGGQIILSQATRDLVLDRLPVDAELTDLGVHRLRDLGVPSTSSGCCIQTCQRSSLRCARWTRCPTTCQAS